MTPQHPHPTPPPAADTVAPVTVPRTYRERVEAIRTGGTLAGQKVRLRCIDIAAEADAALDAARLTNREWIAANGPGGWVDDLRRRAERAEAEAERLRAALARVQEEMPPAHTLEVAAQCLIDGGFPTVAKRVAEAAIVASRYCQSPQGAALASAAVAGDGAGEALSAFERGGGERVR